MEKRQMDLCLGIIIIFFIPLIFGGCTTTTKKTGSVSVLKHKDTVLKRDISKHYIKKRNLIRYDVKVFRDLQELDLDNDGEKEIIAIYSTYINLGGVKVIKINDGEGAVIFKHLSSTPIIKFEVIKGIPTIMLEDIDFASGHRVRKIYRWRDKSFILSEKKEAILCMPIFY